TARLAGSVTPLNLPLTVHTSFFVTDPATTEIYTLSLHDALPILLTGKNLGAVPEEFGHASDGEAINELLGELHRLSAGGMVEMVTGAFTAAEQYGVGRAVGAWLADALVAQRLGWTHAVPLLGAEVNAGRGASRPRRSGTAILAGMEDKGAQVKSLLAAQARAA